MLGGGSLAMLIHSVAATFAEPASISNWLAVLFFSLTVLVMMLVLVARSKLKRDRRLQGLLICLGLTIVAAILDYQLIAPETKITPSVKIIGFGHSVTTDTAAQVSSHGIMAYLLAIIFDGAALVLGYAWLRRLPGWFGEPRRTHSR